MNAPLEVFYDGKCPICRREMRIARRWDRKGRLAFVDFTAPEFPGIGVSHAELTRIIHARLEGKIIAGVEVFRQIFTRFGFGAIMAVTRARPLASVLDWVYAIYSRWRLRGRDRCDDAVCSR